MLACSAVTPATRLRVLIRPEVARRHSFPLTYLKIAQPDLHSQLGEVGQLGTCLGIGQAQHLPLEVQVAPPETENLSQTTAGEDLEPHRRQGVGADAAILLGLGQRRAHVFALTSFTRSEPISHRRSWWSICAAWLLSGYSTAPDVETAGRVDRP